MAQKLNTAIIQANLKWEDPQENRSLFSKEIKALSEDVDLNYPARNVHYRF